VIERVARLEYAGPLEFGELLEFFARRAVPRIEEVDGSTYRRSVLLAGGPAIVELSGGAGRVDVRFLLSAVDDLAAGIERCRFLLDLDADTAAVATALGDDALIGGLVRSAPGRRVPGTVDRAELAIRAVLGQQVSLQAARTLAGRLVLAHGRRFSEPFRSVTHVFPEPAAIGAARPESLAMPESRRRALLALSAAIAGGEIALDGADPAQVERDLLAVRGIGPWTAAYVAMRALGDRDAFPATDLGVRRALERLGERRDPAGVAERWRPYRAYAAQHLWSTLG
jgi:AraC family transcriptional regulator of adaptative response / DNA-3-methyladenine glycosylase II